MYFTTQAQPILDLEMAGLEPVHKQRLDSGRCFFGVVLIECLYKQTAVLIVLLAHLIVSGLSVDLNVKRLVSS